MSLRPPRVPIRRDGGTWAMQSALERRGLGPVVGVDEAGRGACAGPLVVASCMLRPGDAAKFGDLTDSKLMSPLARDRMYDTVRARAVDYAVVVIPPDEVDSRGVGYANLEGMRRAVAWLDVHPGYVLTDGFRVSGFTAPSMAVIKGDAAVACIAAASVLAKVTRDRIMGELHEELPVYGFDEHKGYITGRHHAALREHGPSAVHRWSYSNVAFAGIKHGLRPPRRVALSVAAADVVHNGGSPRQGAESGRGGARVG
ncbi:ribonuclease HII [Kibdelosporangium phytohabitans]|nr:ribonuclease HII [Kibdelosporangium phytohabitans]MBE1464752.1 ribonuclease HII [Kibdelosporangium phytohabitans]